MNHDQDTTQRLMLTKDIVPAYVLRTWWMTNQCCKDTVFGSGDGISFRVTSSSSSLVDVPIMDNSYRKNSIESSMPVLDSQKYVV
jgi:hypothetical protein